ncbi:Peptidase M3A M3B [Cordyceps militaris]|uniref:Peptidase M3A M3B n=1 Tax=Cordyceps militaris TaxID=73501 RepID=A0A2H4ST47_CORMI|nr:Peptidase M3A M3B [Cordyceps militaris]
MDYGKRVAGKNDVLLKEIVLLCHLLALLLGPKSWAEYREPYQRVSTAKALQFVHTMKDNLSYFSGMSCPTRSSLSRLALTSGRPSCLSRLLYLFEALFFLKFATVQRLRFDRPERRRTGRPLRLGRVPVPRLFSARPQYGHKSHIDIRSTFITPEGTHNAARINSCSLNNLVAGYLDRKPSSVVCHICNDQMLHEAIKTERTHVLAESPLSEKLRSEERCENALLEPRFILFPTNL